MREPIIRPYVEADRASVTHAIDELQRVEETAHPGTRRLGLDVAEAYLDRILQRAEERQGAVLVAEAEGRVVGFIAFRVNSHDSVTETPVYTRYGYVSDIEIDKDWRGSGLAQRLLKAAERHFAGLGVERMRLSVLANNGRARRAYAKYGFAELDLEL